MARAATSLLAGATFHAECYFHFHILYNTYICVRVLFNLIRVRVLWV